MHIPPYIGVFAAAVRQGQKGIVSALTKEERARLRSIAEKWTKGSLDFPAIILYLKLIEDHLEAKRS